MGTPAQLTNPNDPTQDLESQITPSASILGQALQNLQNQQPQPQPQPQQPDPSQQQQPPAQQDPAQNAPGGPVKQGLRGVLLQIIRNVGVGGLPAAAYPGDLQKESQQRSQAVLDATKAQTNEANAQTADLQSQAALRTAQAKPQVLIDPQTGGAMYGPDGSIQTGTLAQQNSINDMFKVTGGYTTLTPALAASVNAPEQAGQRIPVNTLNALMKDQSSNTLESEIVRLSRFEVSQGRDPNQSPDIRSLVSIKRALENQTPDMRDEQYRQLYAKQHQGGTLTPDEKAWMGAYEHQKLLVPTNRIQLDNSGGGLIPPGGGSGNGQAPATIDQVNPSIRGQVQAVLDYRQPDPPSGRNNPRNNAIQYWVNTLDPTHDASTFPARNKILNDYTSGPESKTINSIGTAIGHAGDLYAASKAVEQNNLPLLNSIANKFGLASGSDAQSVYKLIANRFSSEVSAAYVQGGGTGQERGANESDFDLSKGAQQIQSNIAESAHLLRSKLAAQEQQWNTTFRPTRPQDQFESRFLTPAARQTLNELNAQAPTATVTMRAPNGQQKPVPANQVEYYKSRGAVVVQ